MSHLTFHPPSSPPDPLEVVRGFSNINDEEEEDGQAEGAGEARDTSRDSGRSDRPSNVTLALDLPAPGAPPHAPSSAPSLSAHSAQAPARSHSPSRAPAPAPPSRLRGSTASTISSSTHHTSGRFEPRGNGAEARDKRKKKQNRRPPSYTDRVLVHTLEDRRDRLEAQHYDFCDALRASDHRAVSLVVSLEVNAGVVFPANWEGGEGGAVGSGPAPQGALSSSGAATGAGAGAAGAAGLAAGAGAGGGAGREDGEGSLARGISDDVFLFELNVTNILVTLLGQEEDDTGAGYRPSLSTKASSVDSPSSPGRTTGASLASVWSALSAVISRRARKGKGKADEEEEEEARTVDLRIDTVDVVFPLPSKDPILAQRRLCEMAKAFHLETDELLASLEVRVCAWWECV